MSALLHFGALVPAAIGLCCLVADRRRVPALEFAAGLVMLAAMVDIALAAVVSAVWWAAAMIVLALVLAGVHGHRGRVHAMPGSRAMAVHTALGLIAMAALTLGMTPGPSEPTVGHAHDSPLAYGIVLAVLGTGYLGGSAVLAVRARTALGRTQYVAMAASVGLMMLAVAA